MVEKIEIRKPLRSEIPQLAELGSRLFQQTFDGLYSDEDLQTFLTRVYSPSGVAEDWDAGCEFWVAEVAGEGNGVVPSRFVGYCKAGPVKVPVEVGERRALELRQIYVERDYHGCGIGGQFMQRFLELCRIRSVQEAYVSCWSQNQQALAFYARFGFEVIGSYDFLVGEHRDHELILRKLG